MGCDRCSVRGLLLFMMTRCSHLDGLGRGVAVAGAARRLLDRLVSLFCRGACFSAVVLPVRRGVGRFHRLDLATPFWERLLRRLRRHRSCSPISARVSLIALPTNLLIAPLVNFAFPLALIVSVLGSGVGANGRSRRHAGCAVFIANHRRSSIGWLASCWVIMRIVNQIGSDIILISLICGLSVAMTQCRWASRVAIW